MDTTRENSFYHKHQSEHSARRVSYSLKSLQLWARPLFLGL